LAGQGIFPAANGVRRCHARDAIAREEIFGPVLAALEFADVERPSPAPTRRTSVSLPHLDARYQESALRGAQAQAGTVWINTYNIYDTAAPFGGYKQVGSGAGEAHALEHYTQIKSVWVDLNQ
jgi:acyl-CoA reductase-like NAD-dependent aldehyde dehydrogenase